MGGRGRGGETKPQRTRSPVSEVEEEDSGDQVITISAKKLKKQKEETFQSVTPDRKPVNIRFNLFLIWPFPGLF